jgi:hypothetical protein
MPLHIKQRTTHYWLLAIVTSPRRTQQGPHMKPPTTTMQQTTLFQRQFVLHLINTRRISEIDVAPVSGMLREMVALCHSCSSCTDIRK